MSVSFIVVEILVLIFFPISYIFSKGCMINASPTLINRIANRFYLRIASIFLGGMMALRGISVGMDTSMYVRAFQYMKPFEYSAGRMECGYVFISSVLRTLTDFPFAIVIVTGIITMLLYYIFIKKYSKWYFLSIICFIFLGFFDSSMNVVRQSIALAIITISYGYIVQGEKIKFIITVIIASCFHSSAILFLGAYLLRFFRLNKWNLSVLMVCMVFAFICFSKILQIAFGYSDIYSGYVNSIYGESGKIGTLFNAAIFAFMLLSCLLIRSIVGAERFRKENLDLPFYLCFIGMSIMVISYNMSVVGRIAQYFSIFQIILLPNALKLINLRNRYVISFIIFLGLNIYYWTIIILRPYWNAIYPYSVFE